MNTLKFGLPSGSLKDSTFDLFERAGYKIRLSSRSYTPTINDAQLEGTMFSAKEITQYVARGVVDVGFTGKDWILENDFIAIEEGEDCRRDGGIGRQDADADVAGMGGLGLYEDTYRLGLEYCAGDYDMLEQAS